MKASELRIGNLILNNNGEVEEVYTLYDKSINGYNGNAGIQPDHESNFNPIKLTEEWLIKLGFEKDEETNYRWFILDESVAYDLDDNCIRISNSWEFGKRKYVHQFQNLYFALTNQELDVKL